MRTLMLTVWRLSVALVSILLLTHPALAQGPTVTAAWDASPITDQVTSYQVCIGTSSLSCNIRLASVAGSQTSYTFSPSGGTRHYVAIRAVNASGASRFSLEQTFSIPNFPQPLNQSSVVGKAITPVSLNVTDPDGGAINFTHTGLPPGLALNASTGQITGSPSATGTYNVTVYARDNLVGVARSWVWTVTSDSTADKMAPALAVTSHNSGQTVTSTNVTISGTATDGNRGDSGITSVRVNGGSASGGTATGSVTSNWSRAVTLVTGANTITVEAIDGAGNLSMQQIILSTSVSTARVTGATLTPSLASPRQTGTAITFTAAASGGASPQQYKFLVAQGTAAAQVVQNWSTTSTYTWTPLTAGNYTVSVWVRSAGVTADAAEATAQVFYTINAITGVNAISATPSSGSGSTETFTLQFSDSRGATHLISGWVWFRSDAGFCLAYHDRATNRVYLLNDAGLSWNYQVIGTNTVLENNWCSIALGSSSASVNGALMTLRLAISFKPAFSGTKVLKMFANASGSLASGWQDRGNWTVPTSSPTSPSTTPTPTPAPVAKPAPPPPPTIQSGVSAVSVTPGGGSGSSRTFTMHYADSRGARHLISEWVWFNGGAGTCMVYHERATGAIYLLNDAGTAWNSEVLGSAATLQNRSCAIDIGGSSVSINGSGLALNLAIAFKSTFRGTKNVMMFANALGDQSSGWQNRGSWIVP